MLTWDIIKTTIDKKLADLGKDGSIEVWYITISGTHEDLRDSPLVDVDANNTLFVDW